jgi:4-amino-4-deoxy-L-arabinose transferase-like glycosyltransferase
MLSGIVLGMAILTRSTFAVFVPCVCLAWLYGARREWRKSVPLCVIFLFGSAATVLPWTYRNYRVYHRVIPVSSGFQTMLWRGNTPLTRGGPEDRDLMWNSSDWKKRLQELPEVQRQALEAQYAKVDELVRNREEQLRDVYLATDEVLGPIAVRYVISNPARTAWLALVKLRTLYSAFSKTATQNVHTTERNKLVAALSFYPVLALAIVGACWGFRRRHELALIYLLVISVSLIYSLLATATRYRLPLDPYLIVFASIAASRILQKWVPQWFDIAQGSG